MKKGIFVSLLTFIIMGCFSTLSAQDLTIKKNKKGKIGLVDPNGKYVVSPKYDEIGNFEGDLAKVRIKDKYGFINTRGNVVLKVQYSVIEDFADGVAKICVGAKYNKKTDELEKGKWGYVKDNGEILIKPVYDDIDYFNKFNIAKTKKGKVYGWVSRYGKELIKPQYTEIGELIDGMARVCKGGKPGKDGKIAKGKWGFVDDGGRIVIKVKYQSAGEFHEGVAWVGKGPGKYSYINKQGMVISEGSSTNYDARNGIIIQQKYLSKKESKTGKKGVFYGILDLRGMVLEDFVYSFIQMNLHNWASATDMTTNTPYFIHNENGTISKLKSGMLNINFDNEIEKYTFNEKSGYVRQDGKIMIEPQYTFLGEYTDFTIASENGTDYGYLSKEGKTIIPFEYSKVSIFNEGYATVCKQNKWYVIDPKNNIALATDMDYLGVYSDGLIPAKKNNKAGFLSLNGKVVIPMKYDMVSAMHRGKFAYKENEKWGIRDQKEKILLHPMYDTISDLYDVCGNKIITNNGKFGLLNLEEKEILPPSLDGIFYDANNGIYIICQNVTKENCTDAAGILRGQAMNEGMDNMAVQNLITSYQLDADKIKNKAMKKLDKKGTFNPDNFIGMPLLGVASKDGKIIIDPYCAGSPVAAYQTIIIRKGQKHASAKDIKYFAEHPNYYIVNYNRFKVNEIIPDDLWDF